MYYALLFDHVAESYSALITAIIGCSFILVMLVNLFRSNKKDERAEENGQSSNLQHVSEQLKSLANGNEIQTEFKEFDTETKEILLKLQSRIFSNEQNSIDWVNFGLKDLNGVIQNYLHEENADYQLLRQVIRYSKAIQGALYTVEANFSEGEVFLKLRAAYGLSQEQQREKIELGEGLIGQAVADKEFCLTHELPDNYTRISSGLGESIPRHLAIFPFIFKEQAYGAIECSFLNKPENRTIKFLEASAAALGAHYFNLNVAKKQRLQLEQLKAQQEQLWHLQKEQQEAYHKMEISLRKMEEEKRKNQAILESCSDGFMSFKADGNIEFANKAVCEILSCVKPAILNQNVTEILPLDIVSDAGKVQVWYRSNERRELKDKTEIQVKDFNGTYISLLVSVSIILHDNEFLITLFIQKISFDLF